MEPKTAQRILVTGANGFIGRRLIPVLLRSGHAVRGLVRREDVHLPAGAVRVIGDLCHRQDCVAALQEVDTAYYLVHALDRQAEDLAERERQAAENFVAAAASAGVRRVIFLSGLGQPEGPLSTHLASRQAVAGILARGHFALTVLRAAIIIGAGGAAYETIRVLVRTQPVLLAPNFLQAQIQPIAIADVIGYLVDCLAEERTAGQSFDIGGPEVFSYQELLERFARVAGEVNLFLPTPLFSPRLVAGLVGLFSTLKPRIVRALLEGLDNEVICRDRRIEELLPRRLVPFDEAVRRALAEEQR